MTNTAPRTRILDIARDWIENRDAAQTLLTVGSPAAQACYDESENARVTVRRRLAALVST